MSDAPPPDDAPRPDRPLLRSGVISEALTDPQQRQMCIRDRE